MTDNRYFRLQEVEVKEYVIDAPVEIEKGALLLDTKTRDVLLQLKFNLLDYDSEDISSITLSIDEMDDTGKQITNAEQREKTIRDIFLFKSKSFGENSPLVLDKQVRNVTVEIKSLTFRDGQVWENAKNLLIPPQQRSFASLNSNLIKQFRRKLMTFNPQKKDSVIYIPEQHDKFWQCTCGRPNNIDSDTCVRCGLSKEKVFNLTEEALQQDLVAYEKQLRLKAIEEQKHKEEKAQLLKVKRARRKKFLGILLLIGVLISVIVLFQMVLLPAFKYSLASKHLAKKDYDRALSIYDSLGDYRDSKTLVSESNYQKAINFLSEKKYDEAIKTFIDIKDYRDSETMILEAKSQKALDLLNNNEYEAAMDILLELEDNKTTQELTKEANYQKAVSLFSNKQFDESILLFSELKDYKDSSEKGLEAKYQKAVSLFSENQFDESILLFSELKDYKDSSEKGLEAKYQKAVYLFSDKQYDKSILLFSELNDYKDSPEKCLEAKYQNGVNLFNEGDYTNAYAIFEPINDYKDTNSYLQETLYELGKQDLDAGMYEDAREKFLQLDNYKDSNLLFKEASYLLGLRYLRYSRYSLAMKLFNQLGEYKDCQTLTQYSSAIIHYMAGEFSKAKQAFSSLGDFKDSKSYLEKTKVMIGIQGTWGYIRPCCLEEGISSGDWNYFVIVGWRMFQAYSANDAFELESILPEQVTEKSINIKLEHPLTYTLSSNSLVIVGYWSRSGLYRPNGYDETCIKFSNTTNNAKILELLKK